MDPNQRGIVNTCFVTTRLPAWAGSRQNVMGSDLQGHPVPSDLRRPVAGGGRDEPGAAAPHPAAGPMEEEEIGDDEMEELAEELDLLKEEVRQLTESVQRLETAVTAIQAQLAPPTGRGDANIESQ